MSGNGGGLAGQDHRRIHAIHASPLWTGEHNLSGRIVTHPVEVDAIARRTDQPRPVLVLTLLVGALLVGGLAPRFVLAVLLGLLGLFALLAYVLIVTRKGRR